MLHRRSAAQSRSVYICLIKVENKELLKKAALNIYHIMSLYGTGIRVLLSTTPVFSGPKSIAGPNPQHGG